MTLLPGTAAPAAPAEGGVSAAGQGRAVHVQVDPINTSVESAYASSA